MKYFTLLLLISLQVHCFINLGGFLSLNQPKQIMQSQTLKSVFPSQISLNQPLNNLNNLNKQLQQVQQGQQLQQLQQQAKQSLSSISSSVNNIKSIFSINIQSQTPNFKVQYQNFVQFSNHNFKKYPSVSQTKYRETIYNKNLKNINSQNKIKSSYTQGLTFYADFTPQQFRQLVLNPRIINNPNAIQSFESIVSFFGPELNSLLANFSIGNFASTMHNSISFISNYNSQNSNQYSSNNKSTSNKTNTTNQTNIQKTKQQVKPPEKIVNSTYKFAPSKTIKPSVDWRTSNRTSPVKMQGSCGNCYAFSATGALQSAYMIKHNKTKVSYSDQQITDCCGTGGYGCNGCEGGWQWQAFQYIKQHGIVSQQQYPNVSLDQGIVGQCQKIVSPLKIINKQKPFIAIQQGNVSSLYEAVSLQPVSVGVDAANMQFASSTDPNELFSNCSSNFDDANHAMLIVGYDTQGNWILKNSWSRFWGNEGYIKLKAGNTCGVANFALYPQVI